jgi:hypothetical protein
MADTEERSADDRYAEYFREKLWELIPGIHRYEDDRADPPGVLRALVELVADRAADQRRSIDRLWDDAFIDLCDDWAVPYIADLVATRLVSAQSPRARRVDVAKTIYYRRRKGTVRVLEELISDIAGWEGRVVEGFRLLGRTHHNLDPVPTARGRWSGTPQGGLADLRDVRAAVATKGPFGEYAMTADVRRPRGLDGRAGIDRVVFHLFRLGAWKLEGVTPYASAAVADRAFTFDPSGRDVPLFVPRRELDDWDSWTPSRPWELPSPMSCRLLAHAEYEIHAAGRAKLIADGVPALDVAALEALDGVRFRNEARFRQRVTELGVPVLLAAAVWPLVLDAALTDDSASRWLVPDAVSIDPSGASVPISRARTAAARLDVWTGSMPDKDVVIEPERGRFLLAPAAAAADPTLTRVSFHVGAPDAVGAGPWDRARVLATPTVVVPAAASTGGAILAADLPDGAIVQIPDSATYGPVADPAPVTTELTVQAADAARPYLRLTDDWTITGAANEATLRLDGLWLGAAPGGTPATAPALVLAGTFARVTLRTCTLDPGGVTVDGEPLQRVRLIVDGAIDELLVERCVLASIETRGGGHVERLAVADSILDAHFVPPGSPPPPSLPPAVTLPHGTLELRNVTVLGGVSVERLDASEALVTGRVHAVDTLGGCFRFSAAPTGSRLPHAYRAVVLPADPRVFVTQVFGQPDYARLAAGVGPELTEGAEDGSEIGAWRSLRDPIKLASLARKVEEYLPFGLVPAFVRQT